MPTNNPWLTPFQRSYNSIKSKIKLEMKTSVPEMTDLSEGNPFMVVVNIFAAIAEVIHYYIDNMAREAFLSTARRYTSVYKHAKLVDYHIKSGFPASVDLTLYRSNGEPIETDITIPIDTVFISTDGKPWVSSKTVIWSKGTYSVKVPISQKEPINETGVIDLGTITSQDVVIYLGDLPLNTKYVEGSMVLTIDGEPWELVDTFAYSKSDSKVYKVEIDQDMKPYIMFGDGKFGAKPNLNGSVQGTFYITFGGLGNIPENSFNDVPSIITDTQSDVLIHNTYSASGGSDYEDFDTLKSHIPLSVKTLGVAITKEDYEARAMLVSGVNKAYCNYVCGRYVEIYITPDGGGEASQFLLDKVLTEISKSKVITTAVTVKSVHGAKVYLNADVYGKKSFNREDISNQVKKALVENYNYNTSDINRPVRLSDIYALIDNQTMVDYVHVNSMYLLLYPEPINPSQNQPELNITSFQQISFIAEEEVDFEELTINIISSGYTIVEGNGTTHSGTYGNNLNVKTTKSEFNITISDSTGASYNPGDMYRLTIQPMTIDLIPRKYNIPIFLSETITLKVNETV